MTKQSRYLPGIIGIAIIALLALCSIGAIVGNRLRQVRLEQLRAQNLPPTVLVHAPKAGEALTDGDMLTAIATASGITPISNVELWVNGTLVQEDSPEPGSDTNTFLARFDLQVAAGHHVLVFRAIDQSNRVGQSPPIPITVDSRNPSTETSLQISESGITLEDLANGLGAPPIELNQRNPGLGEGPLPPGTNVKIPSHPNQDVESKDPEGQGEIPPVSVIPPDSLPVIEPIPPLQEITTAAITMEQITSLAISNLPTAPADLVVTFEDCVVTMHWFDYAENESHFTIWMQPLGGPPRAIATLEGSPGTGAAMYTFKSPAAGAYGFWVEASNALGSQPSEIQWIFIADLSCEDEIATQLEIEALDMSIAGPYDQVYCYLSLEGTPEVRIPQEDESFIELQNNVWNITSHWGQNKLLLVPIPPDEQLSIEGRCLGWQGTSALDILGSFSVTVPKSRWDGSRQQIDADSGSYSIGYRLQLHGPTQAQGTYHFTNPELPVPKILSVTPDEASNPSEENWAARHITMVWEWSGRPEEIEGFVIFMDGEERLWSKKEQREATFLLGTSCGDEIEFQIAAFGPAGARSLVSRPYLYQQPDCEVYAAVEFQTIQTGYTSDCFGHYCPDFITTSTIDLSGSPCDVLSAYYDIWASSATLVKENYYGNGIMLHFACNTVYRFDQIGDNDTLLVPIDPLDPRLRFGTRFREWDFWWDDDIAVIGEEIDLPLDEWINYDETFQFDIMNDEAWTLTTIRVSGFPSVELDKQQE